MITSPTDGSPSEPKDAVTLKGIGKRYPQALAEVWALKGISLDVGRHEVVGIIGRNGSGKTTLLNIIAGTLSATEGQLSTGGKVMGLFNLGVGFQDELSGRENIFLNGAILGASRGLLRDKLNSIIEFSELGDFIDMPLGTYSQGMRLRLGFSIVANLEFDILLLDEVLAVGDVLFQSKCFEHLANLRRAGKTLIITTQDAALIERLCDRVALIDHGRLLFFGDPVQGVSRYRTLLNTEKFFVGPSPSPAKLIENTKKWADDKSSWGHKLGTKEAVIDSVEFHDKHGRNITSIKSREPFSVKVGFNVRDCIKEPHFGVAIFRNDGVYCYGPNTAFDECFIPELKPGRGYFRISYKSLLLAPGEYRLSVAIWDKNERLAFNYHEGCHPLTVEGQAGPAGELLNMPFLCPSRKWTIFPQRPRMSPDLSSLVGLWGKKVENGKFAVGSVELASTARRQADAALFTGGAAELRINFAPAASRRLLLWVGLYRDDGVYCQGFTEPLKLKQTAFKVAFPALLLLPGSYRISVGVWNEEENKFSVCHHGAYPFRMVFDKEDHGTVYLDHKWDWKEVGS